MATQSFTKYRKRLADLLRQHRRDIKDLIAEDADIRSTMSRTFTEVNQRIDGLASQVRGINSTVNSLISSETSLLNGRVGELE